MKHSVSKSFVSSVEKTKGGVRFSNVKRLLSKDEEIENQVQGTMRNRGRGYSG